MNHTNKVALVILDGYGQAPSSSGNAISQAKTPNIDYIKKTYPKTLLMASGEAVGLPKGEMGSSEVGHLNIGAGRIVLESLARINMAIADGSFFKNKALINAINHVKKYKSKLHLLGLLQTTGVHANIEHLYALLFLAKEYKVNDVYIHIITDGRDSLPKSGITYIEELQNRINRLNIGKIASVMGRYYALDRDHRWERTEKAYLCLTECLSEKTNDIISYIIKSYHNNITDEFIIPACITADNKPIATVKDDDAIIFFNFRVDRPRQLTKSFVLTNFQKDANITDYDPYIEKYYHKHILNEGEVVLNPPFIRKEKIKNLFFVTMTEYEENLPVKVAFPPEKVDMPLGLVISKNNMFQLRLAESEKEKFVTFYFNGLVKNKFKNEDRLIIPSPKIATYDLKPEMSAYDLTSLLISKMKEATYDFILVNFANPDMVAHTSNIPATIKCIEVIDECIGKIIKEVENNNYYLLITSDHGHAEQMKDPATQEPTTAHTSNLVPFYIIHPRFKNKNVILQQGILADIAPTIIKLFGLKVPKEMTGRNLLEES